VICPEDKDIYKCHTISNNYLVISNLLINNWYNKQKWKDIFQSNLKCLIIYKAIPTFIPIYLYKLCATFLVYLLLIQTTYWSEKMKLPFSKRQTTLWDIFSLKVKVCGRIVGGLVEGLYLIRFWGRVGSPSYLLTNKHCVWPYKFLRFLVCRCCSFSQRMQISFFFHFWTGYDR